jgi:hypothetical protein
VNEDEAVALARYVHAVCPQQKFDEYTADTWGDVLGDLEFEDCKRAVIEIARRQPWVAPAEIIAEVKRNRTGRLDYFQYEPTPGETAVEFTHNLRAQIAATIDGHRPPQLPYVGSPRPVLELTAGQDIPEEWETTTRVRSALDVSCPNPQCRATTGKPCKTPSGKRMAGYHGTRLDASKAA